MPSWNHALRAKEPQLIERPPLCSQEETAEGGFTLIELMVVLLIMAILLAIAIPTFLGLTSTAHQRSAQSNLTNALISVKGNYAAEQSYLTTAAMVAALNKDTPSISFTSSASTPRHNSVSVNVALTHQGIILVAAATTGSCWAILDSTHTTVQVENTKGVVLNNTAGAAGHQPGEKAGTWYATWGKGTRGCSATMGAAATAWATPFPATAGTTSVVEG